MLVGVLAGLELSAVGEGAVWSIYILWAYAYPVLLRNCILYQPLDSSSTVTFVPRLMVKSTPLFVEGPERTLSVSVHVTVPVRPSGSSGTAGESLTVIYSALQ